MGCWMNQIYRQFHVISHWECWCLGFRNFKDILVLSQVADFSMRGFTLFKWQWVYDLLLNMDP